MIPFRFNNLEDFEKIIKKSKECAAIVLEPCRENFPTKNYLSKLEILLAK